MKKIKMLLLLLYITFFGCKNNIDCCVMPPPEVRIVFTHHWDGIAVTASDFNEFKYTNAHGEKLSIEKLRYLISNVSIVNQKHYFLADLRENAENKLTISDISTGKQKLSFTFGFNDLDNIDGVYSFLNSVNFNVPKMLGGGYHYMQFDGKFINTEDQEIGYNFHAIRAVDRTDPNNLVFKDTSFEVDLGLIDVKENTTIEIKVNIAEWFKNPNTWNLNELHTVLMPNFEAQKMMSANGASVFTLGKITP